MPHITNKNSITVYGEAISPSVKSAMTIMPLPMRTDDGEVVPYAQEFVQRYADLADMKRKFRVYVEEYVQDDSRGDDYIQYAMIVRGLSNDADMQLILNAAKHMCIISSWSMRRCENDHLDSSLDPNYIEVCMRPYMETILIDDGYVVHKPLLLSAEFRNKIWIELFEAAGYIVCWGNAINVKRHYL